MPLTGTEPILKGLIIAESTKLIGDPKAIPNLEATAEALANAIVQWVLTAGKSAAVTPAATNGNIIPPPVPPAPVTAGGPVIIPIVIQDLV